jgi:hypothetical protein
VLLPLGERANERPVSKEEAKSAEQLDAEQHHRAEPTEGSKPADNNSSIASRTR